MSKSSGKKQKQARLGELLLDTGLIAPHQLSVALGQQAKWGGKLGSELIRLGFIGETELAYILEKQLGIKWVSLKDQEISTEVIQSVSHETARKYHIMPVECSHQTVTIAMVNPNDLDTLDAIAFAVGKTIKPVMALESDIEWALSHYYDSAKKEKSSNSWLWIALGLALTVVLVLLWGGRLNHQTVVRIKCNNSFAKVRTSN